MVKKTKLKNILYSACCLVLAALLFGLTLTICNAVSSTSDNKKPKPDTPLVYWITYKMVSGGKVQEVYEPLFKEDGSYPIFYEEGKAVTISDLNGRVSSSNLPYGSIITGAYCDPNNSKRDFSFYGWFLDESCTIPLIDNTFSDLSKDVTLYAKISIGYWTDFY